MAEEPSSGDAYDIVLADLKAKRAQLDHAIAAIEAIKSGNTNSIQPFGQSAVPIPATEVTPGMFHGMSIVEAVKQLLAMRKKPLGTQEITEAITTGGVVFSTDTPANTVGSVLHRESNKATGAGIVSVSRGTWALPAWYPNPGRFQKKRAASGADPVEVATEEQEEN